MEIEFRDYLYVLEVVQSCEDEVMLKDFVSKFELGKDIDYQSYFDFCIEYIDDMSEIYYINCNWMDEYDEC